jgi:hypothetical protein
MAQRKWFHGDIGEYITFLHHQINRKTKLTTYGVVVLLIIIAALGYFIMSQDHNKMNQVYTIIYVLSSIFSLTFFGLLWTWLIEGNEKLNRRISLIKDFMKGNPEYDYYRSELGFDRWTHYFSKSPTDISDSIVIIHHYFLFYIGVPMKEYPPEFIKRLSPYLSKSFQRYNFEERMHLKFWLNRVDHPFINRKKIILEGYGFWNKIMEENDKELMFDRTFPMASQLQEIFVALRTNAQRSHFKG